MSKLKNKPFQPYGITASRFSMTTFIELSRNAFVSFRNELPNGFAQVKNTDDLIIYASRLGEVYKWEHTDDKVVATKYKFTAPQELTQADIDWLIDMAKNTYKWHGGVKKLKGYLTADKESLEERGIDPFFYGWMAQYGYQPASGVEEEINPLGIVEDEFDKVIDLVDAFGGDCTQSIPSLISDFVDEKKHGGNFDTFAISVSSNVNCGSRLRCAVENLVRTYLPSATDETTKVATIKEIVDKMVSLGASDEY